MVDEETMRQALLGAGWEEVISGVWRVPQKSFEGPNALCTTGEAYAFLRGEIRVRHRIRKKKP